MSNNQPYDDRQVFLAAYDPLMARYQTAEQAQLEKEDKRLEIEFKQTEENCKSLRRTKEDIGVRLYGLQQQLAENQVEYERAHENHNQIQKTRLDEEQRLKHVNEMYEAKKAEVQDLRKKKEKAQKELDATIRNVQEVRKYNENSKNQILITKTVSHTAEENVMQLEKDKKRQDYLIDQMTEEMKRLIEESNIISAQLVSQKAETEEAKKILADAQQEMQKILASKKNLLERWQKSLTVMAKMDITLQSIRDHLDEQREVNLQLKAEVSGIAIEISNENQVCQEILAKKAGLDRQRAKLEEQANRISAEKQKVLDQHGILTASLKNTELEIASSEQEIKSIEENMNSIESNIMKLHTETKRQMEELINQKSLHMTIEKTATNLMKQAFQIAAEVEEQEMELAEKENEIARVRIDQLNTKSQVEALEKKKSEVIEERKKREVLVATYEINIRQSQELNEKKQHEVGELNKINDKLTSMENDENNGLHETKLRNLHKEADEYKEKNEELLRDWMKKQTTLVHKSNVLEELNGALLSLQTKKTILEQKKVRLNESYKFYEKEIGGINISLKNLQKDMNKLNDGLADNADRNKVLDNEIFSIESEFVERLKEFEKESVRLEISIDNLREEKAVRLAEIVEAERQILLWERNIELEKEVKSELDPNIGQSELKDLKNEIHKMQLKLNDIKKKQEVLQTEMVREVPKREAIELKYTKPKEDKKRGAKSVPRTSAQMESSLKMLKHQIEKTTTNSKEVERVLKGKQGEHHEIIERIEEMSEHLSNAEADVSGLSNQLALAKIQKQVNLHGITERQKVAQKVEEIRLKKAKLTMGEARLRDEYERTAAKNKEVAGMVHELMERLPHYQDLFKPLLGLD
jgi:chromosome segregation ATPase